MSIVEMTQDNFDAVTAKNDITIIDFWAEWCGPCRQFAPLFAEVAANNPGVTFAKVDVDSQRELASTFAVRSIPHIVVMKQNVVVYAEAGSMPASSLQNLVDQAKAADTSKL